MDSRKKKLLLLFFLVIFSIICLLSIKLLNQIKLQNEMKLSAEDVILQLNWPSGDVPFFYYVPTSVDSYGENFWNISVDADITYDIYREYLLELYSEGFEPDRAVGSENPRLMYTNLSTSGIDTVFWKGIKDEYTITALWANDGAIDSFGEVYEKNLYINLHKAKQENNDENKESLSGDDMNLEELSGDILSGDNMNAEELSGDSLSADILNTESLSGDDLSGDVLNRENLSEINISGESIMGQNLDEDISILDNIIEKNNEE